MDKDKVETIIDKCISGVAYSLKKIKERDEVEYWKGYRDSSLNILENLGLDLSKIVELVKDKNEGSDKND